MQTQSARLALPPGLALKGGQLSPHSPVPAVALKRPAGHGRQTPLSFPKPAAHTHSEASVRAGPCVVVFAEQAVQATAPSSGLYFPVSHAVHGPPSPPVYPARQRQASGSVLAVGLREFTAHAVQEALPLAAFHVPSAHAAHGPPSSPECPAAQTQSVRSALPAAESEAAGQGCAGKSPPSQ